MRAYTLSVLQRLQRLSGSSKPVDEEDIIKWVNSTVSTLTLSSLPHTLLLPLQLETAGKAHTITSFKDASISTSLPVIDLIDAMRPGKINYDIVDPNPAEDEVLYMCDSTVHV